MTLECSLFSDGRCLQEGEGLGIDFNGAAHYFTLADDPEDAVPQNNDLIVMDKSGGASKDFRGVAHYFKHVDDQRDTATQNH
jgi:hypothetical protein